MPGAHHEPLFPEASLEFAVESWIRISVGCVDVDPHVNSSMPMLKQVADVGHNDCERAATTPEPPALVVYLLWTIDCDLDSDHAQLLQLAAHSFTKQVAVCCEGGT